MGFRGEALSSLCNIANLAIVTKRENQSTGWIVKFDHMGNVTSKEQIAKKVIVH
jgi:DNA mismatch repair ATPase MutL